MGTQWIGEAADMARLDRVKRMRWAFMYLQLCAFTWGVTLAALLIRWSL